MRRLKSQGGQAACLESRCQLQKTKMKTLVFRLPVLWSFCFTFFNIKEFWGEEQKQKSKEKRQDENCLSPEDLTFWPMLWPRPSSCAMEPSRKED